MSSSRLGDAVVHRPEGHARGVRGDAAVAHAQRRGDICRRVAQLARPGEAVHALAERTALLEVVLRQRPDLDPVDRRAARLARRDGHRLLDVEAERLVEAERAHVECVLKQPDARARPARARSRPPSASGPHPSSGPLGSTVIGPTPRIGLALVEEVRADDLAVDARRPRPTPTDVRYPGAHHLRGGLEHRKVTLEAVMVVNAAERVEDDLRHARRRRESARGG